MTEGFSSLELCRKTRVMSHRWSTTERYRLKTILAMNKLPQQKKMTATAEHIDVQLCLLMIEKLQQRLTLGH